MTTYLYIKALHIVFVVAWFAALFYIVRLFIYQTEASKNHQPAEVVALLQKMAWRLWYMIGWPAMFLTLALGVWLLPPWWGQAWMNTKLILVAALVGYHVYCHRIFLALQRQRYPHSSLVLRFINEGATVLLLAIVFVVELKHPSAVVWAIVGVVVLGLAVFAYKRFGKK